jgi:16S rRNA (cytosine967-C5)-methyltransferase
MSKAREIAVEIINKIETEKKYSNLAINNFYQNKNLSELDKGFITELVYGYLRWRFKLNWYLMNLSDKKPDKIPPLLRIILLTGIYQIVFMDKVPDSASVNESVNLAKRFGYQRASGFVNGVLRNFIRKKDGFLLPKDNIESMAVRYSFLPANILSWEKFFDHDFLHKLMEGLNIHLPISIRLNTLLGSIEEIQDYLVNEGIEVERYPNSQYCYKVIKGKPQNSKAFSKGLIHIQSLSSMKAVEILDPKPEEIILDACSSPGGKTTYLSQLMDNKGTIHSLDLHPHRIELVERNCLRLGVNNVKTMVADSTKVQWTGKPFDRILIDAPCSGTGVITNKPEIKWNVLDEIIPELNKTQLAILSNCSNFLKPGGSLIYATCSIDPRENQRVVEKFLEENNNYELDRSPFIPSGYINFYPHLHETEGFFIAKLKRLVD